MRALIFSYPSDTQSTRCSFGVGDRPMSVATSRGVRNPVIRGGDTNRISSPPQLGSSCHAPATLESGGRRPRSSIGRPGTSGGRDSRGRLGNGRRHGALDLHFAVGKPQDGALLQNRSEGARQEYCVQIGSAGHSVGICLGPRLPRRSGANVARLYGALATRGATGWRQGRKRGIRVLAPTHLRQQHRAARQNRRDDTSPPAYGPTRHGQGG